MAAKIVLAFCASCLLLQTISAQCINKGLVAEELLAGAPIAYGPGPANSIAYSAPYNSYGSSSGCGYNVAPTSGGSFRIISSSPISPTGLSVFSENTIEGPLSVMGELPFLSAVALEGELPTSGAGGINYGCGGAVGIVNEGIAPSYGSVGPAALAPSAFGYEAGLTAPGFPVAGLAAGLPAPGLAAGLAGPGCGCNGFGAY